ncbi:E3 ubiquitin-protein ligase MYCBP2-like [Uloborus diversus]|uniref:E3 ubiquitin-protein ligase MYCBP2-like n=1 Tax=Uloborus diversus TaxID=327109 RepID=UPI00240984C7|nr:E3 ubiquitin-protein ligase MYCBP2-like [Uloborus diversus]
MAAADVQQTPDNSVIVNRNNSRSLTRNMRCGPHCKPGEISEDVLRAEFHEMFRQFSDQKKKIEPKKTKKKTKSKAKDKHKSKGDSSELPVLQPPFLAVRSNPSSFVVFAIVRLCVLEKQTCEATRLYLKSITSSLTDSESEDDDEHNKETSSVPKIVGVGLCGVFELIKESQKNHPHFCLRALQALLDMLQGQQPEGLKNEPPDVIDALFDLLLEISSTTFSAADQSQSSYASTLTSYACACLLSLVVAKGDTGKLLSAASAMLMSSQILALEEIPTPGIMASLQRSVHAVLFGKTVGPDWLTHGFPSCALFSSFAVQIPKNKYRLGSPITSDGKYLYIFSGGSIYKIGSGFGGTIKGQIIMSRGGIKVEEKGWLGFCQGYLYFQAQVGSCNELVKIDVETLKEKDRVKVDVNEWGPCAFFTDGDCIGLIIATKEDSFIIKMYKPSSSPMTCVHELTLKLARKCLDVFGSGIFDDEATSHTLNIPAEDEPASIACGKDFALMKTVSGKIMYSGKAQSLGIKQGGPAAGKWAELPITKSPKIIQYSVGHDGQHAILIAEDGSAFFVGTARRGEDGDQSKGRRQPKPTKPKKMIKLEAHHIVSSACNNGTSALVSQSGELFLFGKDTAHADHNIGLVTDIKEAVTQVALGKAHIVALTNKGHVYTFGINHKGQCGREFIHGPNREAALPIAMATATEEDGEDEDVESEEPDIICPAGRHQWNHDHCMVCTVCGECTGYGASCIAGGRPDRNPGLPCGCGAGDSGCMECGCCRSCARENDQDVDVAAAWGQLVAGGLVDNKQTDIIVFDVRCGRAGVRLEDRLRRRIEEYRIRQRRKQMVQSVKTALKSGLGGLNKLRSDVAEKSSPPIVDDVVGSDQERETTKLTALPPARMNMPTEVPVIQIACGLHHNVLLVQTGDVYTFGNNQHGQLGHGDFNIRGAPTLLKFPSSHTSTSIIQVAAGSCHTVLLNSQGQVYTFGNNQKGQLKRSPPNSLLDQNRKDKKKVDRDKDSNWNAVPGLVPNVGTKYGRRATWIGASGDQTFVKIDESLINSHNLSKSSVVCSKTCIGIIPNKFEQASSFKSLVISKADGSCRSFSTAEQLELRDSSVCLDSTYNVLWSFSPSDQRISLYNIIITELQNFFNPAHQQSSEAPVTKNNDSESTFPRILNPELMLPFKSGVPVSRAHAALNILSSLDTLTSAQEQSLQVLNDDQKRQNLSKVYSKEDFSVVNRFDSHGGGWGYSGHSIEAIRFMTDTDILLGGFGLFGGRGEYTAKLKVFDIGPEGGDQEIDGDVLVETDEIPYECGARHKFPMLFDEPIQITANRWYVAWARISGPSSDCGSSGQSVVTTDDQIVFYFKSSKKSNNGTDVNAGQIPQLLYRTITPDNQGLSKPCSQVEPVTVLSKEFSRTVSPDCFHSLLRLLRWAWQSFKAGYCEAILGSTMPAVAALLDLERLEYICTSSLHLLKIYINEIYPNGPVSKKSVSEVPKLAECVADVRALLQHILSDRLPSAQVKTSFSSIPTSSSTSALLANYLQSILEECHVTFLACYHAFYPSSQLKWRGLCDLLLTIDVPWVEENVEGDHLLAAVLASLCSSSIRLTSTLPVTLDTDLISDSSPLSPEQNPDSSPSVNGHTQEMSPGLCGSEVYRYPVLIDCVAVRTEREGCNPGPCSFREVLDRLLSIVKQPLDAMLHQETVKHSSKLISNACAFIAVIVAELSYQSAGTVLDMHGTGGQVLHVTPSRFTKVSQNRTWNTGNGSPDAICFSVDRSGILISGVTVYGGIGNEWHYELELLDDQSGGNADPSHTQRWKTLAIVRGTFGPEDCYGDVAEIKFERPVPIKENVKYAVRLRNHGSRTNNGDGGLSQVKGPDGCIFTFTDCSLSFNGTNHTRGQIPQILYYSTPQDTESVQNTRDLAELQARRNALSICNAVVKTSVKLFAKAQAVEDVDVLCAFGTSHVVTMLLPLIFAHLGPVATSDPRSAVQVLSMVQDLLPLVASLNKKCPKTSEKTSDHDSERCDSNLCTTSNHYAIVESDHPYRPASVASYRVTFPSCVQWLSLEFDPQCGTAQVEDTLQIYIPSRNNSGQVWLNSAQTINVTGSQDCEEDQYMPYWPVFRKFSGSFDWPTTALLLPGNEVVFSLETASDYVKDEKACFYGFRCQVIGFECPRIAVGNNIESWEGLKHLERELAYLGGMCAASLMRRDLVLPPSSIGEVEEDLELIEELSQQVYKNHSLLLSKGFALAHAPSIHQALEGVLPFSSQSNEHSFLKDFVSCSQGTSGGRLARWLQPESYVDPKLCELLCSQEELKCGWPAIITVITKDQYGKIVQAPSLKVEVLAVPMNMYDKENEINDPSRKLAKVSKPETGTLTFGGHLPPNLETGYEISVKDKMFYYAITVMKEYENYSFEELRYVSPAKKRLIENMLVRTNNDGTYTANWTPGSTGWYLLRVVIDGIEIGGSQQRSVEVKEPPQGLLIPSKQVVPKAPHQPNRVRKFAGKFSAGLRVRSHPSLQSEQIGTVRVNDTVSFVDELRNDDGVWVRLSSETVRKYCQNGFTEAWCLQYNQHLGKTLLIPVEEPKSMLTEFFKDKGLKKKLCDENYKDRYGAIHGPGIYHVVKCGASGHNIRSRPSLKASAVGMLVLANVIGAVEVITNSDGIWAKLDKESKQKYCFNMDGEAWTLIRNLADIIYLQHEMETLQYGDDDDRYLGSTKFSSEQGSVFGSNGPGMKGFDFATAVSGQTFGSFGQSMGIFTFGSGTSDPEGGSSGSTSPFVFGSPVSTPSVSMNTLIDSEKVENDLVSKNSFGNNCGRVAALQKWLKEESSQKSNSEPQRMSVSKDVPSELQTVSVKELVKAIGESRANGNAATPPRTPPNTPPVPHRGSRSGSPMHSSGSPKLPSRRSSSPIPIAAVPGIRPNNEATSPHILSGNSISSLSVSPKSSPRHTSVIQDTWPTYQSSMPPKGSSGLRRSSLQSDTSVSSHFSSLFKELSQTSATGCIGCITQRNTISPISTPGTPGTPATPGTPKKEANSIASVKSVTQTGTQTSPDSVKSHFSIGSAGNKEEPTRISPKLARKERSTRQFRTKRERVKSPSSVREMNEKSKDKSSTKDVVKEAMTPSVAECLRAVFAAFLWHEGIVHDAMACASFLKFNPTLPKQITSVPHVAIREKRDTSPLTKEQKARYRHSVEVASPSLLTFQYFESFSPTPFNANINKNKLRKTSVPIKEDSVIEASRQNQGINEKNDSITSTNNIQNRKITSNDKYQLPHSLQHLVILWEQISSSSLRIISQQLILPSPVAGSRVFQRLEKERNNREKEKKVKKKKDYRPVISARGNLFAEATGGPFAAERESMCELCGNFFPYPVTYHMRQAHPGCGDHAGGKGYNSGGNFCGGWAGNCGDGGIGGSSWYLICDRCREKFIRQKRQSLIKEKVKKSRKKSSPTKLLSPLPPMEAHQIMKNNALFLLELSSSASSVIPTNVTTPSRLSFYNSMPSVNEQNSFLDSSPFPMGSFQCLDVLGVQQEYKNMIGQEFLSEEDIRALQNGAENLGLGTSIANLSPGIIRSSTLNGGADLQLVGVKRERQRSKGKEGENKTRTFHRSISVGLTSRDWSKQVAENVAECRIIMTRKRNNSSGCEDTSTSFLCQPSAALTKLVSLLMERPGSEFPLHRPVMVFLLQRHDLESLQLAMKQALRKAACRVYALQALNWLLRCVTQPMSLHDLLWCFVAALSPAPFDKPDEDGDDETEKKEHDIQEKDLGVCEHPLSDITIAGEATYPLPQTFHAFLQTVSDLMMLLPVGSSLQQIAMRCWCLKFHAEDHSFLHRSHVFSNISKILSRTEEEDDVGASGACAQVTADIVNLKDITPLVDIKASSRQAMVNSLTDNTTETFWESGDEDRNKVKMLNLSCGSKIQPKMVYIHIDNCRDLGNKVSGVTFKAGPSFDEMAKLKQLEVENRYIGWLNCDIPDGKYVCIRIELKGPDNTLRLRQVKILGTQEGESVYIGKKVSALQIQQKNCEAETLKVFRLLTSQVFGKLISGENECGEDRKNDFNQDIDGMQLSQSQSTLETNDLKEHMVGILFSRSKLTHLQKQVCSHIVAAIRKEASRVRDEWEALLCSKSQSVEELPKSSDAYCFEMLSMVLALSGSNVGRSYLAQQAGLLRDLFSLLHTGSARVQRQVTSLLRRVLPEVSPPTLALILGVNALPPTDFSIISEANKENKQDENTYDVHCTGILDVFLACIAKALTVQTKVKGSSSSNSKGINTVTLATSIHPRDFVGNRWWLRGCMARKLAEVIIQLLKDMAAGKLTEAWATVTKGAIAENILNLTKLEEQHRSPSECLRTPTLWLALASLCVLDQEHVERLSSGQWVGGNGGDGQQAQSRPFCDNHDDSETPAIILCATCGNLCAECDRYLHLNRKTRNHQRQVFKEEEEAIKVDLHEGCGRTKLFWVMCLADSKTLKAMVEFREGTRGKPSSSGVCRFCGSSSSTGLLSIGNVCNEPECQEHASNACSKMLNCGHMCGGIYNENPCLPCLHRCGGDSSNLKQDADDMCMICFIEALAYAPAIQLSCGHLFHLHCCRAVLTKKWSGPRITFRFSLCPICQAPMDHSVLKDLLDPARNLFEDVKRKALMRLEYEGLHKAEAITTPGTRFYKDPAGFAMDRYAYYVCYKCKKAYYGGEARCDAEAGAGDDYDPTELVCGACSDVSRAQMCPKHGTDFLEYKCRYCCSVAVFFCFGTTHFCNACHDDFQRVTNIPKAELPHCPAGPKAKQLEGDECPLHVKHPSTGEEFALGCGVCRNAHTF